MKVHPAAEAVRLMFDDELASLAADIEVNGQRDAITLGKVNGNTPVLVDGRNRLRACEMANVEPRFETLEFKDDDEVIAFVRSRSERRDITKGERAMALALLYPEPEKGGRGKKAKNSKETLGFSTMRLSQARAVLAYSRELALAVRDGAMTLDDALAEMRKSRDRVASEDAQLARLRAEAPDLAELVREERMKISEAYSAFEQRQRDEAEKEANVRETLVRVTEAAYRGTVGWAVESFRNDVVDRLSDMDFRRLLLSRLRLDPNNIEDIERGARALATVLDTLKGHTHGTD